MRLLPIVPVRAKEPFDDLGWLWEVKLDGWRGIIDTRAGCRVISKNGHALRRFRELCEELPKGIVLDGEIVAFDPSGRPIFDDLMHSRVRPTYVAFDLLFVGAEDLRPLPLRERRRRLDELALETGLQTSVVLEGDGPRLFELVREHDLEGIVGKKLDDPYAPGRTRWLKVLNPGYSQKEGRWEKFQERA